MISTWQFVEFIHRHEQISTSSILRAPSRCTVLIVSKTCIDACETLILVSYSKVFISLHLGTHKTILYHTVFRMLRWTTEYRGSKMITVATDWSILCFNILSLCYLRCFSPLFIISLNSVTFHTVEISENLDKKSEISHHALGRNPFEKFRKPNLLD